MVEGSNTKDFKGRLYMPNEYAERFTLPYKECTMSK